MRRGSCNFFLSYYRLNELTKYIGITSVYSLTNVNRGSLWAVLDKTNQKNSLEFYHKTLLILFLFYILTGKPPTLIKTGAFKDNIVLRVNLYSRDFYSFLDKFFLLYDIKSYPKLLSYENSSEDCYRMVINDLDFFTEIGNISSLFQPVNSVLVDFNLSNVGTRQGTFRLFEAFFKSKVVTV
jgi:hypothetical protein